MLKKLFIILMAISTPVWASGSARPDSHAPIGVMGDHFHHKGEFMASYRYMNMHMEGNRNGTEDLSISDVLDDYMMAGKKMDMDMHMVGGMWALTDRVTLTAMMPYIQKSMTMTSTMATSKTESEGWGDLSLGGLINIKKGANNYLILNTGLSFPTGSIDKKNDSGSRLPYSMQIGSGTTDLKLGLTYVTTLATWSWGLQGLETIRLGENDNNYRLGNVTKLNSWIAKPVSKSISISGRLGAEIKGDIHGADSTLNTSMSAGADTDNGKTTVSAFAGINFLGQSGILKNHRIAAEVGAPLYQDFNSTQLKQEWSATVGWQRAF